MKSYIILYTVGSNTALRVNLVMGDSYNDALARWATEHKPYKPTSIPRYIATTPNAHSPNSWNFVNRVAPITSPRWRVGDNAQVGETV